jgi:hypothetical protein
MCEGCGFQQSPELCEFCKNLIPLTFDPGLIPEVLAATKIDGCLFPNEEAFLAQLAKECTGSGVIVELGSYLGRSTTCLGIGSQLGRQVKIFTLDNYQDDSIMTTHPQMFNKLLENLYNAKVLSLVHPFLWSTHEPLEGFNEDIELLLIDADHVYESVKKDFLTWEPHVVVGGRIAFHDTYDPVMQGVRFMGPLKVIKEFCIEPKFKILGRFQAITVVQKVKND